MKYSLYFFLLICTVSHSQNSIFIRTGKNVSNYSYTNKFGNTFSDFSSEFGNSHSIGYSKLLKYKLNKFPIFYNSEFSFDEFSASVYNKNLSVHWKTLYVGFDNSLLLQVLNSKKIKLDLKLGSTVSKMIYGKQELDGEIFDLKKTNSFKGFFIGGVAGLQVKYLASDFGGFSLGYDYIYIFNPTLNGSEKFSISTNRIYIGVIFNSKSSIQ